MTKILCWLFGHLYYRSVFMADYAKYTCYRCDSVVTQTWIHDKDMKNLEKILSKEL